MLTYHRGDERPHWQATVPVNGVLDNMTAGYTFLVKAAKVTTPTVVALTYGPAGIVGAAAGVVTVGWIAGTLNIDTGLYNIQLVATRTSDSSDWTVDDQMQILPRL